MLGRGQQALGSGISWTSGRAVEPHQHIYTRLASAVTAESRTLEQAIDPSNFEKTNYLHLKQRQYV